MHYWPKRKDPRRGIGGKIPGKIEDGRQLEPGTDERIGAPKPPTGRFTNFTPLTTLID